MRSVSSRRGEPELDLPSPRTAPLGSPRATAPLPSPGYPSASNPTGIELDLPDVGMEKAPGVTALPTTAPQRGGIDLPSVSRSQANLPAMPGVGLPAMVGAGLPARPAVSRTQSSDSFELPSPRANVDLPSPGGLLDIDLPLSAGELPMPIDLDLPSPSRGNLPALGGDLPALGGNLPMVGGNLPALGGSLPLSTLASRPQWLELLCPFGRRQSAIGVTLHRVQPSAPVIRQGQ